LIVWIHHPWFTGICQNWSIYCFIYNKFCSFRYRWLLYVRSLIYYENYHTNIYTHFDLPEAKSWKLWF
jgi:hypothetical protein